MVTRHRRRHAAGMPTLTILALVVSGLVHLLPTLGVQGAPQLARLYGVTLADPDVLLLLRHRAILFGVVGGLQLAAAASPPLRTAGLLVGLVSALGYVVLAWPPARASAPLARVAWIDVALVLVLGAALLAELWTRVGPGARGP